MTTASGERDIGIVIVGTGWGALTHVPALQRGGFDIKAMVGTDAARTRQRATASGINTSSTDLDEALALPGVEAVVIATPPATHAELVLTALRHGKHVLCEKPFSTGIDDARTMVTAAEQAGVVHAVGHEMRWVPQQAAMTAAIQAGRIGTPTFATYLKVNGVLAGSDATVPDWFGRRSEFGGWLNAELQHVIDEVRTSLGEFVSVTALETSATIHDWDASESFAVQFELAGGVVGVIQSSVGTFGPPVSLTRISGTEGTVWISPENDVMLAGKNGATERLPVDSASSMPHGGPIEAPAEVHGDTTLSRSLARATARFAEPTRRLYKAFRASILSDDGDVGDPALPTFRDGLANTAVHEAVRRSIGTGATCAVAEVLA
ncbi:Gfo/Idh/MocA family protein [Mycolicibacterium sp. P9-22]|uniref:Gfo/Idh/MocA family protein n=1 Tax=Mycolicibacterium sp. P9-22 TaxID=2024613 RepID=UPI0011EC43AD|nr:Gfo/Idh/MocA family oxidoreductase [Mycolicibacterium sp. P9-22]KAA0120631.1 gfo/Idh/MocA family oxidoreductase [Mycolicibacterium sp. P9-22]